MIRYNTIRLCTIIVFFKGTFSVVPIQCFIPASVLASPSRPVKRFDVLSLPLTPLTLPPCPSRPLLSPRASLTCHDAPLSPLGFSILLRDPRPYMLRHAHCAPLLFVNPFHIPSHPFRSYTRPSYPVGLFHVPPLPLTPPRINLVVTKSEEKPPNMAPNHQERQPCYVRFRQRRWSEYYIFAGFTPPTPQAKVIDIIKYSLMLIKYSLMLIKYSLMLIKYSLTLIEYSFKLRPFVPVAEPLFFL